MTWLINLLTPLPETDDGWYLLQAKGNYAREGLLQPGHGDLEHSYPPCEAVAVGMQSIAIFG